jgi:hypothetical protein
MERAGVALAEEDGMARLRFLEKPGKFKVGIVSKP